MSAGAELIPACALERIEAQRTAAIGAFAEAFDKLDEARGLLADCAPSDPYASHLDRSIVERLCSRGEAERERFLSAVTKHADTSTWRHLLRISGLERLMDATAKEQFQRQVTDEPPPATADNCRATMQQLFEDAETIFRRGVATAFARLDRRFRSHDGFKVGARIVLTRAIGLYGSWSHYQGGDATLRDVERAFYVLDGRQQPDYDAGIIGTVNRARPRGERPAFMVEDAYFRVRVFGNGNVHVWFKRGDLVERVNRLLAEYYGDALGDARQTKVKPASQRPPSPARSYSLFPTPAGLASRALDEARVHQAGLRVLEPSAGTGALALPLAARGAQVTAVEIQPGLVDALESDGRLSRVIAGDFLALTREGLGRFDRIVMNPPFCGGADADHVRHALGFLAPGGRLVAIMSASVKYSSRPGYAEVRQLIEDAGGQLVDLPERSFAEAGTNINTVLVTISVPAPSC